MSQRKYDSTVARIAGNILSGREQPSNYVLIGDDGPLTDHDRDAVEWAVALARFIVAEVERTEPKS